MPTRIWPAHRPVACRPLKANGCAAAVVSLADRDAVNVECPLVLLGLCIEAGLNLFMEDVAGKMPSWLEVKSSAYSGCPTIPPKESIHRALSPSAIITF